MDVDYLLEKFDHAYDTDKVSYALQLAECCDGGYIWYNGAKYYQVNWLEEAYYHCGNADERFNLAMRLANMLQGGGMVYYCGRPYNEIDWLLEAFSNACGQDAVDVALRLADELGDSDWASYLGRKMYAGDWLACAFDVARGYQRREIARELAKWCAANNASALYGDRYCDADYWFEMCS